MESLSPILTQKQLLAYDDNFFKQLKVQTQFRSQSSLSSNVSSISSSTCSSNNITRFTENFYLKNYSEHQSNSNETKTTSSHRNCQKIMPDPAKYYAQLKKIQTITKEDHIIRSVSPNSPRNEPPNKFNFDMSIKLNPDPLLLSPTCFNGTVKRSMSKINLDNFRASSPFNSKSYAIDFECKSDTNIHRSDLLQNDIELEKQKSISSHRLAANYDDNFNDNNNQTFKSIDKSDQDTDKKIKKSNYEIKSNFIEELSYKYPEQGSDRIPIKKLSCDDTHLTRIIKKRNFSVKASRSNSQEISCENLGKIKIKFSHNEELQQLIVTVIEAADLIAKDSNGFSDPFVKICLLPGREKDHKRRTHHVLKNLNPVWNHSSVYPNVYREELRNKTLEFSAWDWDRFKKNDFLGIVRIDLNEEVYLDNQPRWFRLKSC